MLLQYQTVSLMLLQDYMLSLMSTDVVAVPDSVTDVVAGLHVVTDDDSSVCWLLDGPNGYGGSRRLVVFTAV